MELTITPEVSELWNTFQHSVKPFWEQYQQFLKEKDVKFDVVAYREYCAASEPYMEQWRQGVRKLRGDKDA